MNLVLIAMIAGIASGKTIERPEACKVFCEGPLLDAVQKAHIFPDSKHFVDMPMVYDADTTLMAFEQLPNKSDANAIRDFVFQYFTDPGTELLPCQQADWLP